MATPHPFTLTTPLPADELRFEAISHASALSTLEETHLQLVSEKSDLDPEKLLGKTVDLAVTLAEGDTRHICGHVTRFGIARHAGRWFGYQAVVRPWLWFLTRTADCRIFQDLTVREIVEQVFKDHAAIAHYEFRLVRTYRKRVYCVQYRETDFNFVARLLEDEGIYWYFEHRQGDHKLVLMDAPGAHPPIAGEAALPYYDNEGQVPPGVEYVSGWLFSREVRPGKTVLTSYDFERPSTNLKVDQTLQRPHALAGEELFDFQGDYTQKGDGQQLVDDRLDEQQCRHELLGGRSNSHTMATGYTFKLLNHPRDDQNGEYVCTRLELSASEQSGEAGSPVGHLQCSFGAIRSDQTFRPERGTHKPFVQGPQTAVVVGPSGEEIFTDKYGRVKVKFHWDRHPDKNEKSSCWLRVSSPWAGKSFGFVQLPRIGQEVVVDFLEGDPDQPLITGRVYNAEQMPPWDLPANATQSGVLSRSSKGGAYGNANALRFEDRKGSEQVWLHAEKNQDIEVENDETHWVGHDRKKTIDHDETTHVKHDRTETVDNNETITIHGQRTETVDKDETITIHQNRTETVDGNESITIHGGRTETVDKNESITIGADRKITVSASEMAKVAVQRTHLVGANETIGVGGAQEIGVGGAQVIAVGGLQSTTVGVTQSTKVAGAQDTTVGGNRGITVAGNQTLKVGASVDESITGNQTVNVGKTLKIDAGADGALSIAKNLSLVAGETVVIKTGDASITLKKDGSILIKGKDIKVEGSGKINIKASSDLVAKGGSKVTIN